MFPKKALHVRERGVILFMDKPCEHCGQRALLQRTCRSSLTANGGIEPPTVPCATDSPARVASDVPFIATRRKQHPSGKEQ